MWKRDASTEKQKKKVAGCSTKLLGEVAVGEGEDTEGKIDLWKELCGQMEEEVLDKYRIEEEKKAYRGSQ